MKQLTLTLLLVLLLTVSPSPVQAAPVPAGPNTLTLPDGGWRLWPDTQAQWEKDATFLPEDVHLDKMPTNAPTGGWGTLSDRQGISVTLPSTVEQHYWGKFGLRPYTGGEYINADSDPQVKNGNYIGVSWWWRALPVPVSFVGKTVILHVRGARQRAEVYVNQKLVGYSMIEETSFDCDVTQALKPGQVNQIAIRITNPGGRLDWGDWMTRQWGGTNFFLDHGFGGLDRGITLTAHSPVYVADAWVLNTPDAHQIQPHARIHNVSGQTVSGRVLFSVRDPKTGQTLASRAVPVQVAAGADFEAQSVLRCPSAQLWNLKTPRLYTLRVQWQGDVRDVTFGFRWFAPEGVGTNAVLRLNGQRIRVVSAISWGFWGLNGLWPTPALAIKEVTAAKQLGLNCLNFHRNLGKAEVLDVQDRMGLLRYMEPGGGQFAIGKHDPTDSGEATSSLEKYQEDRILQMIRDARSHPSLVVYVVQNEATFDLKNPRVFALLKRMHREDPSRTIVLKSGIETPGEAWMKPYDDTVFYDHGDGYSGWSDHHTVGSPDGTWQDGDYKSPDDYVYRTTNTGEIVDWGEMGGSATPDNSALMVAQIKKMGGHSYDLLDHQQILDAYNAFVEKWGFRAAFPTTSDLFTSIGDKEYDYWANVIENARLSDASDYLTISGWETTALEDHSGLVDNLRNFKGHPELIRERLAPLLPVAKPHQSVLSAGESATLDLYLLNETNKATVGPLKLTLTRPDGKTVTLGTYPVPTFQKDRFVYPIQPGVVTPPLTQSGVYQVTFALPGARQVRLLRVIAPRRLSNVHVGVLNGGPGLLQDLNALPGVVAEVYRPDGAYSLALLGGEAKNGATYTAPDGAAFQKTDDPTLYRVQCFGKADNLDIRLGGLPPGKVTVTLLFAETYFQKAGQRVFDVVINGQTVLKDFDIFAEAGGENAAVQKTFTVDAPEGVVDIRPGNVAADNATFAAVKVEAGGKTQAVYFGGNAYTDKSGQVWQSYQALKEPLPADLTARVRTGLPLLVMTTDDSQADVYARALADAGAWHYDGLVGRQRAPWMGSWYFVRAHPVYDGLPVNEAMKGDYQVAPGNANGLRVSGDSVQIIAAYGRDHDRNLGAGTFTAHLGQGTILFHAMPSMSRPMQTRFLENALAFLSAPKKANP